MELWQYYRILKRRKWLIVIGMLICVGSVALYNYNSKQLYMGRVKVMERSASQRGVPVYGDRYGGEANLQIHLNDLGVIATSEKVLLGAARTLEYLNVSVDPEALLRTVKVEPVPDTQILRIEVISPSYEEAKNAADVIAREFQDVYGEIMHEPTSKSREFIQIQLPKAKEQLTKVRSDIRNFKEQSGIVQLSQQSTIAVQRVSKFRDDLVEAEVGESQAAAQTAIVSDQMAAVPGLRESGRSFGRNPIYMSLETQLNEAHERIAQLEVNHLPEYPDLIDAKDKARSLEQKFRAIKPVSLNGGPRPPEGYEVTGYSNSPNPLHDTLMDRFVNAEAARVVTKARKNALQKALSSVEPDMARIPAQEMKLAQLLLDQEAAEQTYKLLRQKLDEARIKESESKNESAIKIVDEAYASPVPDKQRLKLSLALLLSPMLSAALIFVLHYLDNTVKTPAEAEELLSLPVFAVVPLGRRHSLVRHKDSAALREIYQMLSANLWSNVGSADGTCVLMASAEPDTGRSVTASNLAVTLAADGARVILVDADFRQPAQHLLFGVENKYGLSNVLGGGALIEDVLRPTQYDGLLLMTSGPLPDNPVRLLRSPEMKTFVEQIGLVADFVIFDSPSGSAFADSSVIATHVRNVVIVHAAGRVSRGAEDEFRSRLEQAGGSLVGAVLNMVRMEDSHELFHYRRAYRDVLPPERAGRRQLAGVGSPRAIPTDTGYDDRQS